MICLFHFLLSSSIPVCYIADSDEGERKKSFLFMKENVRAASIHNLDSCRTFTFALSCVCVWLSYVKIYILRS